MNIISTYNITSVDHVTNINADDATSALSSPPLWSSFLRNVNKCTARQSHSRTNITMGSELKLCETLNGITYRSVESDLGQDADDVVEMHYQFYYRGTFQSIWVK